jgi:hypothetical protein
MLKYICAKTIYDKFIKKCKYTQEIIEIKLFKIFIKILISIKHCDFTWLFVSHMKSLIIIISQMSVFWGDDHKYAIN